MGWKAQLIVLVVLLMGLGFFWGDLPRRWRVRLALSWAAVLALALGYRHFGKSMQASELRKEECLPEVVSRPGTAGRRFGSLRVYLSAPPELQLESKADNAVRSPVFDPAGGAFPASWETVRPATREWTVRAASMPLLVVLENDSYAPLDGGPMGWTGPLLCTVRAVGPGGEAFRMEVPMPEGGIRLLPAERRAVEVHWPLEGAVPGEYRASVRLPFGESTVIETGIRLY